MGVARTGNREFYHENHHDQRDEGEQMKTVIKKIFIFVKCILLLFALYGPIFTLNKGPVLPITKQEGSLIVNTIEKCKLLYGSRLETNSQICAGVVEEDFIRGGCMVCSIDKYLCINYYIQKRFINFLFSLGRQWRSIYNLQSD